MFYTAHENSRSAIFILQKHIDLATDGFVKSHQSINSAILHKTANLLIIKNVNKGSDYTMINPCHVFKGHSWQTNIIFGPQIKIIISKATSLRGILYPIIIKRYLAPLNPKL